MKIKSNVAVLGASRNPEKYSNRAVKMLGEHGYKVFPVHPSRIAVDDVPCFGSLGEIGEGIDTVTVYLSEKNSTPVIDEILQTKPRRVILNPGAENDELKNKCEDSGIEVLEACTLVLLSTGRF